MYAYKNSGDIEIFVFDMNTTLTFLFICSFGLDKLENDIIYIVKIDKLARVQTEQAHFLLCARRTRQVQQILQPNTH